MTLYREPCVMNKEEKRPGNVLQVLKKDVSLHISSFPSFMLSCSNEL